MVFFRREPAQALRPGSGQVGDKPFVEHLEDLRRAVIGAAVSLGMGLLVAIPLAPSIITLLKLPLANAKIDPDEFLKVIRVGDGFAVAMQVVFWSGLLISLPGILLSVARFIYPGLTPKERRVVTHCLIASIFLFVLGVAIGYLTTVELTVLWMLRVNDWLGIRYDFIELADYCGFVLRLLLAFGLVFEMPIVVIGLGAVGLIHSKAMRAKRRHVIVGLMALAMVLGPPDPGFSMMMMSIPLILLYEGCIWIVWGMERKQKTEAE